MAIAFSDIKSLGNELTPQLSNRHSEQLKSCFAAFKRIEILEESVHNSNFMFENLKLIDKYSIRIDCLRISTEFLEKMMKFYKNKEVNLNLQSLKLSHKLGFYFPLFWEFSIEDKVVELINKIDPKILTFEDLKLTSKNIEAFAKLNCPNINASDDYDYDFMSSSYLIFCDTPIQLFDPCMDCKCTFECELIRLYFEIDKTEKIRLFNRNTGTFLFIPTKIVKKIIIRGKRKISREQDIAEQLADLHITPLFKSNGLIVPIEYSKKIFIRLDDYKLDYLNQIKYYYQVFQEKHIELMTRKFDTLLKINKLYPDDFPNFGFKFCGKRISIEETEEIEEIEEIEELSMAKIMDNPDLKNLEFTEISKFSMLSPNEFNFWCKMLRSGRTRLNLYSICLIFNLLSECLTVLSLCSNCPNVKFINLKYCEADKDNELETVKNAKREFMQNFEIILKLNISKFDCE